MKLLVDTHVLVWMLAEPDRIPRNTFALLSERSNEFCVSAVSAFELATKHRIGKFPEAERLLLAYPDYLRDLGAIEVPVTSHHGILAGQLAWEHRDPFDRLIAAQALAESMVLVTADPVFAQVGGVRTVWS